MKGYDEGYEQGIDGQAVETLRRDNDPGYRTGYFDGLFDRKFNGGNVSHLDEETGEWFDEELRNK